MTTGYNREEEYFQKKDKELLDALIHQTVWVIAWKSEDEIKIKGAWFHHPTEVEQRAYMMESFPEVSDWKCVEFTIKERITD